MGGLVSNIKLTKINNLRYRQLQVGNDYYLLDLDTHIWVWFIPTSVWWFPMKAHKLDGPIMVRNTNKRSPINPYLVTSLMTAFFVRFSNVLPVLGNYINIWLLFLVVQFIIILWKVLYSKKIKFKTPPTSVIELQYKREGIIGYYKVLSPVLLFFFGLCLWCIHQFIMYNGMFTPFILLIMLSATYYFFNNFVRSPEEIEGIIIK